MQIKLIQDKNNQKELEIILPKEQASQFFVKAAQKLSAKHPIKGFRPGAAPWPVVAKHLGYQKVYQETAELALQATLKKALQQQRLTPLGQPEVKITQISPQAELIYRVTLATEPEIKLPQLTDLKVAAKRIRVTEQEVKQALTELRRQRASYLTLNRPAQKNDIIEIDFELRHNGVLIEGGQQTKFLLKIGQDSLLPGFDQHLEGMEAGQTKQFSLQLPDSYPAAHLAGRQIEAKVTVRAVQKEVLPRLNDEFAKKIGRFENLDQLQNSIKDGLKFEKQQQERRRRRAEILKLLRQRIKLQAPPVLVRQEAENLKNRYRQQVEQTGLRWEEYLEKLGTTEQELEKAWLEQAEKNIKNALILKKIAQAQQIKVSPEEVEAEINKLIKHYPDPQTLQEEVGLETLAAQVAAQLRHEKTLQFLEQQIKS